MLCRSPDQWATTILFAVGEVTVATHLPPDLPKPLGSQVHHIAVDERPASVGRHAGDAGSHNGRYHCQVARTGRPRIRKSAAPTVSLRVYEAW